jgi:antitoxin component of MazEF toxin-antitoxin module
LVRIPVKVGKIGNSVRVTLPRDILREADVQVGDILMIDFDVKTGRIILEKESK